MIEKVSGTVALGALEIEVDRYLARLAGRPLDLTRSEFELLAVLVANRARVLSRSQLSHAVGLPPGRSVDVLLTKLRKVIGPGFVRNVRKRGWIIVPESLGG